MIKKTLKMLSIFLFLLVSSTSFCMIGQSESQMIKDIGAITEETSEGYKVFQSGSMIIHAHFSSGLCDNMVYLSDKNSSFSDHIVSTILCVESSGLAWIVDENSIPERVMYSTPDNKFHAILVSRNKLSIFTDSFLQKRKKETGK